MKRHASGCLFYIDLDKGVHMREQTPNHILSKPEEEQTHITTL